MALDFDKIGLQTFHSMEGLLEAPRQTLKNVTWPGADGVAYGKRGKHAEPSQLITSVDVLDLATGHALKTSYAAMVDSIVTIRQASNDYPNMIILDVSSDQPHKNKKASGGVSGGIVTLKATWTVQFKLGA